MDPPTKSKKFPNEGYYLLLKFIKKTSKIGLDAEETIGIGMKIFQNFGKKSSGKWEKRRQLRFN